MERTRSTGGIGLEGVSEETRAGPGDALRRYRALAVGMGASDLLSLVAALLISYLVRFGPAPVPLDFVLVVVLTPIVWILVFRALGLYAPQRLSPADEFRRVIAATSIGMVLVVMASFWSKSSFSRSWIGLTWLFALVFELGTRRLWRWYGRRLRLDGRLAFRTLVVGTNDEAMRLVDALAGPGLGFRPLGLVATDGEPRDPEGPPVLGRLTGLAEVIREQEVECLFVASTAVSVEDVHRVTRVARDLGVDVRISANLPEILTTRLTVQPIGPVMTLSVAPVRLSPGQAAAKRAFDLVLAGVGLALALPLLVAIAIAVRLTSSGPVLYRQVRVGRRGRPFTMLKVRTMIVGAERMRTDLTAANRASPPLFKIPRDPRITRVGRWLRRWSLDELPQLWNVLKGEMSLVGPRPPLPEEVEQYREWHRERLQVAPGITGLWQVSGRSDLSFDDYVRLDLFYIENWSLSLDLYVMLKSAAAILSGRGSY